MSEMRKVEIDIFNKIKSEISEVFDIGAYTDIDYYTLYPTAKYHLFEPMKDSYNKLNELTHDISNIKINNVGCSNKIGTEKMYRNISSIFIRTHDIVTELDNYEFVNMIRLEDYINDNNIQNFDFIKIDVEGSECLVLDGLGKYLNEFKFIQIEYGGTYQDANILLKDIFDKLNQYNAIKLETGQFYTEYNISMEDYICCNYLFYKPEYNNLLGKI